MVLANHSSSTTARMRAPAQPQRVLTSVKPFTLRQRVCRTGLTTCKTAAVELSPTARVADSSPTAAQSPNATHSPAPAAEGESFNWTAAWYPLAAVSALKQDAPNAQQLLGQRLVVWWDKSSSSWRCFEDLCPHRLAPLSEGRIHESGQLQCTYHGWTFGADGACTSIPQIADPKAHATACSSSRSCVKSHPVCMKDGLLWVYGDSSNSSGSSNGGQQQQQQQLEPPASVLIPEGYNVKSPWFQRDVPLSYEILLENFLDPAHVPHSHHGVVGDRNALHTLSMSLTQPPSKDGFAVSVEAPARWGPQEYSLEFKPPCLVRHNFPEVRMLLYGVPTAPGHSRVIMTFVAPPGSSATRPATPQLPAAVNFMLNLVDRVPALQHALNRNAIIDGDTYFLHAAERVLYGRGDAASWRRQYYLPGSSDAAVVALRKWLDGFGASLPVLPAGEGDLPPLMPREAVMDRLSSHTQNCPHCSAALRNATIAAGLMAAVAAVAAGSIVAAVVCGTAALASPFTAAAAGVALAAGLVTAALLKFRQLFIFTDYVHAEH